MLFVLLGAVVLMTTVLAAVGPVAAGYGLDAGVRIAAIAVSMIVNVGALFVSHVLSGASQIYGVFGLVLGLLAYLYLQAVIVVFCAEINVVRARRLWPRNLLTPFINDVELTAADRASYRSYVNSERFKPSQQVQTTFDHQPSANDKP